MKVGWGGGVGEWRVAVGGGGDISKSKGTWTMRRGPGRWQQVTAPSSVRTQKCDKSFQYWLKERSSV